MVLLIGVGFVAGRARLMRPESVRDLSNPVFRCFVVAAVLFFAMRVAYCRDSRASVRVGIPLSQTPLGKNLANNQSFV